MKGFLRFSLLLILISGFSVAANTTVAQFVPPAQHFEYEKGRKLYDKGLYQQSVEYFQKYLDRDREPVFHEDANYYLTLAEMARDSVRSEIYANRFLKRFPAGTYAVSLLDEMAGRHYQAENYETARKYYGRAYSVVADEDQKVQFLFWMAESSLQADDADSASVLFANLAETWPESDWAPKALYARGSLYLYKEDYDTSAEVFEELKRRYPNHSVTRQVGTALGELHYRQERYEEAIRVLRSELSYLQDEALLKAILLIAESHNYLGQFDQAAAEYRRYIHLSEDEMQARPAYYGLGWVYHKQQVFHWAADSFRDAARGDDQLARKALYYEAINRKLSGRYDLALESFDRFGQKYTSGFWVERVYYEWGLTAFELGRNDRAIEVLQGLVRADINLENPGKIYSLLGEAYFANNEFARAIQAFEIAEQITDVDPDVKRQAQFQRGWVLYENHAYREARQAFEAVYRDQPSGPLAPEALFWSADSYFNLRQWGNAARQFARFVDGYPDHRYTGAAIYSLGWSYFNLRNFERAIHYFEEFDQNHEPPPTALFPYEVDARLRLGDSFYALRRYDEAIRRYDLIAGADTGGDYAIFQIGNSHFRQNESFEAARSFRRLLRIYPESRLREQAQYNVGYIYFQTSNYDQAIEEFHSLINRFPGTEWAARAQYQIGDAFYNAGNYEEAIEAYRIILDEYPQSNYIVDAVNGIQFSQQAAGDDDSSLEILESFLNQHPQTGTADQLRYRRAENLVQAGDFQEAIASFRHYIRVTTSESMIPEAYFGIGEAYEQLNDKSGAVEAYYEIVNRFPESDRMDHALLHIGRLELERDRPGEAIIALENLVEREGRLHVEALSTLGDAYLANNQLVQAESAFDRALQRRGNHDPSLIGKGKVALQTGQYMDAERFFRQVAESNTLERGAEAQYYLGKVEQARRNHNAAIDAFSRVSVLYETYDNWVAKAMLATAMSYRESGQRGRAEQLKGVLTIPPDKSIAQRAALFSLLSEEKSVITNYPIAEDPQTALRCIKQLGASVERSEGQIIIRGVGRDGLITPVEAIDCGNSGTVMRLLSGILAGSGIKAVLTGDTSLTGRPMKRIIDSLAKMGAVITAADGGYPPLSMEKREGPLLPLSYRLPVASAQLKSCVLLAGLFGDEETQVIETVSSRNHTETMLRLPVVLSNGETIISSRRAVTIPAQTLSIPGDFSAAAFWLVAGSITKDSQIAMPETGINPTRCAALHILRRMGADITISNERKTGEELVADLLVRSALLKPVEIRPDEIPNAIDELPVLSVAMAFADGVSRISGAEELRFKESDRLAAIEAILTGAGVKVEARKDGLTIYGNPEGVVHAAGHDSRNDHRIAMSAAILSLKADGVSEVRNADAAAVSYPEFWSHIDSLAQ